MQGPQTSRKASEVEVPATQNLTVHGFNLPQWESWFTETYHHITMFLPKVVLKKKTHISQLPWFFQEVPPTGEILKMFGKLHQILKLPCCRMANINFTLTFKAKRKLFSSPFSTSFSEKKYHSVHYKKWSSENPPKILVKFGALPPGATGKAPPQTAATRIVAVER